MQLLGSEVSPLSPDKTLPCNPVALPQEFSKIERIVGGSANAE